MFTRVFVCAEVECVRCELRPWLSGFQEADALQGQSGCAVAVAPTSLQGLLL